MRGKVSAAIVGLVLAVGGLVLLGLGVTRLGGPGSGDCGGDACLGDLWFLAFPGGIIAITFGLIIAAWALGAIREQRGDTGPLRAFGVMSGLGGLFLGMGIIFLLASPAPTGENDGVPVFLGALFGLMGLAFIGVDVLRFRGELKKDRLRVSGLHGTARVTNVTDTNVTVNNSPMVNLNLEVTLPGQAPFTVRRRTVISRLSVGAMTPGAVIAVLADPAKPRDIVLDWEGSPALADTADGADSTAADAMAQAMRAFFPAGAGVHASIRTLPGGMNADVLRSVSQALAMAAQWADRSGGATNTPDGTTVIDGGTTVVVNGQVVQNPQPVTLAGLPAMLAGAFGTNAAGSGALVIPDVAPPASEPTAPPSAGAAASRIATASAVSGPTQGVAPGAAAPSAPSGPAWAGSAPSGIDVPLPGGGPSANGVLARVNLDFIQDTGVDVAGNRLYTFDLTVSVAGRQPYQTKHAAVVPTAQVPRLVRGASFPAQVDPDRPEQIRVQWDH